MSRYNSVYFALVSGAALVAPAYAVDYLSAEQAQQALFPSAAAFNSWPVKLTKAQKQQIRKRSGVRQRTSDQPTWRVVDARGEFMGWFIIDNVIGKHAFITYAVGLSCTGTVMGVEVMSYRETHGGEVRDAGWRAQFAGKAISARWKLGGDVSNISGATLSCRNIMNGIKRLLALQEIALADDD